MCKRFQPGEGSSRGFLCDCESYAEDFSAFWKPVLSPSWRCCRSAWSAGGRPPPAGEGSAPGSGAGADWHRGDGAGGGHHRVTFTFIRQLPGVNILTITIHGYYRDPNYRTTQLT